MADHGGKRDGAGRKPARGVRKVPYSGRCTPEVKAFLEQTGNLSKWVEDAVRRSKQFRDWCKSRDIEDSTR